MNDSQGRGRVRLAYLFWSGLLLLALACNAGTMFSDEPTAGVDGAELSPDPVGGSDLAGTADTEAVAALWADEIAAMDAALASSFTPETAFAAVVAAMERGYGYEQVRAGILDQRLQGDGRIVTADGGLLEPMRQPAGVLDLTDLEVHRPVGRFRPAARDPHQDMPLITATRLMRGVAEFSEDSESDLATSSEYRFTLVVVALYRSGYTLDQIVDAVVLGQGFFTISVCSYLVEIDPETNELMPVPPRITLNRPRMEDDDPCLIYVDSPEPEPAGDNAADVEGDGGDVAAFCTIYETMLQTVNDNVDAYAAEQTPNCVNCGAGYLEAAEAAMEIAYDQMALTAPAEIEASIEYVATQPLVNILTSEEGAPPELEAELLKIDDFAAAHCAVSLQGQAEDTDD